MQGEPLVVFKQVNKTFHNVRVLIDFSFTFLQGYTYVICGRSGVGKSTLLRTINALEPIDSGEIYFKNIKVTKHTARYIRKHIGMVFQQFNLFPHLTVLQNITFGPIYSLRKPKREVIKKGLYLLERFGLQDIAQKYPAQISGGQQQRVAIIRALCMDPDLILMDEPTSALDPEMIGEVLALIKEIAREGRSLIIVTHEMGFAKEAAHFICFMDEGRFIEVEVPEVFFTAPKSEAVRRFLAQIKQV